MTLGHLSSRQHLKYLLVLFSPQEIKFISVADLAPFIRNCREDSGRLFHPKEHAASEKEKKREKTGTIDKWMHKCGQRRGNFGKMWNWSSGSHPVNWLEKMLLLRIILHNTEHKWYGFHILAAVQSKDSFSATGHWLFLYLFRNDLCSEAYRVACWQFLSKSGAFWCKVSMKVFRKWPIWPCMKVWGEVKKKKRKYNFWLVQRAI